MRPVTPRLRGGLLLEPEKQRASMLPLGISSVPEQLSLTLDQYRGPPLTPTVQTGDPVKLGQVIARPADDTGAPLHSPVSGRVVAIRPASTPSGESVPAILLENDGRDDTVALQSQRDYRACAPERLRQLLADGGIVGLGGAAFPTHVKVAGTSTIEHLLLNGAECEPHISCDDALMRERAPAILTGAQVLLHMLDAPRCTIAVEDDKPEAIAALRTAIQARGDSRLEVAIVPAVYPAGGERQLIASLYGKEVPAGGLPRDIGVLCQNVGTAAAIATLIDAGLPLVSRIVTVTGGGVAQPRNLEVRLGTSFAHLVAECGGYASQVARLIAGGSMMGTAVPHDAFTVSKATNCVLVASPADLRPRSPEMPCIRCGNCSDVCPAGLLPQELYRFVLAGDEAGLERYGLADCIECGCCDHVCPSQIPMTSDFTAVRNQWRASLQDAQRRQNLKDRYLAHTERLATLESERQRRLKARRPGQGRTE